MGRFCMHLCQKGTGEEGFLRVSTTLRNTGGFPPATSKNVSSGRTIWNPARRPSVTCRQQVVRRSRCGCGQHRNSRFSESHGCEARRRRAQSPQASPIRPRKLLSPPLPHRRRRPQPSPAFDCRSEPKVMALLQRRARGGGRNVRRSGRRDPLPRRTHRKGSESVADSSDRSPIRRGNNSDSYRGR